MSVPGSLGFVPLPRVVAKLNKRVTNRLMAPLARRAPNFGILHHTGRTTGRVYATPVNVFDYLDGYVIALTYGAEADWVQNVLASGTCRLETRGTTVDLHDPVFITKQEAFTVLPLPVRLAADALRVNRFLYLRR